MAKHKIPSSEATPFRYPFTRQLGSGQDNRVYELEYADANRGMPSYLPRRVGERVVKASIEREKGHFMSSAEAFADARYKKEKYTLLKGFLGDFIPTTSFAVGQVVNGARKTVTKSYSVQERVPQVMLSDLTAEQRNSDALRGNMYRLATRLQTMHQVLGRARDIVDSQGSEFLVENTLDLGPLSKYVRDHTDEDASGFNYANMINGYKSSPNILVSPGSLDLYCVDFGQGEWTDELEAQYAVVYDIMAHDPDVAARLATVESP